MLQSNPPKTFFDVYDHSLAVEFYSSVLLNVSPYSELPIHQLIGHRGDAPPAVQRVAINPMGLKQFLTRYPTIFTVTENNCVKLVKTIADLRTSEKKINIGGESVNSSDLAVEYYVNVLKRNSGSLPIKSLIGSRSQAPPVVQNCAKNVNELYSFLNKHPEAFTLLPGKLVALKQSQSFNSNTNKGQELESKPDYDDKDCALAVEYYSKILKTAGSNHPICRLIGHRGQAPPEVKRVAYTDKDLKSFLSRFPNVFSITGNEVTLKQVVPFLKTSSEQYRLIHINPKKCDFDAAVEFYASILRKRGCYDNDIAISVLVGYRNQAPLEVQNCAKNPQELHKFFSNYPNVFTLTSSKRVTLTPSPLNSTYNVAKSLKIESNDNKSNSTLNPSVNPEKSNLDIAAQFYANILKEKGCYGKDFPIHLLTGYRSQAPLEVRNSAKNPQELYTLFSNYPNLFTLTSKRNVTLTESPLKKIVNEIQNINLTSRYKNNSAKAVDYYIEILRGNGLIAEIDLLEMDLCKAPIEVQRKVRNKDELIDFFLKFPNRFTVVGNEYVKLVDTSNNSNNVVQNAKVIPTENVKNINIEKREKMLRYFPSLDYPTNISFSGSWEDHVLENTVLVTEEDECLDACKAIKKEKIIAFDCEGYNLGRGIISLIQIALINGTVYIFDIYGMPRMISLGLEEIIESDQILKVINYCKNDCLNLKMQYGLKMKFVFDVSIAFHVIEHKIMSMSNFKPAGFNQICSKYGVPTNTCKDDLKSVYISQPDYWLKRPLNIKMVSYAAFDVASLVPYLYCEFMKRMNQQSEFVIWKLSQKMCNV